MTSRKKLRRLRTGIYLLYGIILRTPVLSILKVNQESGQLHTHKSIVLFTKPR